MDFLAALKGNRPFRHPDMIGAYMIVAGELIHRDNVYDFDYPDWIEANCCQHGSNEMFGIGLSEVLRTDWEFV